MNISASSTIRVEIDGQKFDLTQNQAEELYNALGRALNKKNDQWQYPTGVRTPIMPLTAPATDPWQPPFTVTCSKGGAGA